MMGFYAVGAGLGAFGSSYFTDKQLKLYVAILFFVLGSISLITYTRVRGITEKPQTNMNFVARMTGASVIIEN